MMHYGLLEFHAKMGMKKSKTQTTNKCKPEKRKRFPLVRLWKLEDKEQTLIFSAL